MKSLASIPQLLIATAVLLVGGAAHAASLGGFTCITNNSAGDCAIGESQLSGDLTGNVLTITMNGPFDAVVEQVFIEGAVTSGTFLGGSGGVVAFGDSSPGGNLPGGNPVGFDEAINFAAGAPPPKNGIGPHPTDGGFPQSGQFLLVGDVSDLRIGVHVIGYGSGGSESFVTGEPGNEVPEPSAAVVFGLGALLVGSRVRRQRS